MVLIVQIAMIIRKIQCCLCHFTVDIMWAQWAVVCLIYRGHRKDTILIICLVLL